jgi:ABC-type transport system involved in multi-copper enzyme maturation permease subunit
MVFGEKGDRQQTAGTSGRPQHIEVKNYGLGKHLFMGLNVVRNVFLVTIVVMCVLAFVWPFAVSADPALPLFKWVAIATLNIFFILLFAVLVLRIVRSSSQ